MVAIDMKTKPIIVFTDISLNEIAYGDDTTEVGTERIRDADDGWAILQALQDDALELDSVLVAFGDAWPWLNNPDAPVDLKPNPRLNWTALDPQVSWIKSIAESAGQNDLLVEKGSILQYQFDSCLSTGARKIVNRIRKNYSAKKPVTLVGIGTATDIVKVIKELSETNDLDSIESITLEMGLYGRYANNLEINGNIEDDSNLSNDIGAMIELLNIKKKPPINFVPFNSVRMGLIYPDDLYCLPKIGINQLLVEGTNKMYFEQESGSKGFHFWDLVTMVSESDNATFETVPVKAKVVSEQPGYPGATGSLKLTDADNSENKMFVRRMPLQYQPDLFNSVQDDPSTKGVVFPQFDASNNFDDALLTQIALKAFYSFTEMNLKQAINDGERLVGTNEKDILIGYDKSDHLVGRSADDILTGQGGRDHLSGGDGDDHLCGGFDDDLLEGGNGADTFVVGFGVDVIVDFNPNQGDKIAMRSSDIGFQQVGENLNIIANSGEATAIVLNTNTHTINSNTNLILFGQ